MAEVAEGSLIETFWKRWAAADQTKKDWEKKQKVNLCYNYWRGDQLVSSHDGQGRQKVQVNKIFPEVKNAIAQSHYYRPFARINPRPEHEDSIGNTELEDTRLLQDTVNYLIRHENTGFIDNTYLAHMESFWALGIVEVGYSAHFTDDPEAPRPDLKEKKDTKTEKEILPLEKMSDAEVDAELSNLKSRMKGEQFYVKHIPAKQFICSASDKPLLMQNDWVGYWEDIALEDVKRAGKDGVYNKKVTDKLKPAGASEIMEESDEASDESRKRYEADRVMGNVERIRIYKMWDLRRKIKYVFAEKGADSKDFLQKKPFKRCPLKFYRQDIDPYHFYPIPPIKAKLGPQDEYNTSRDWLARVRNGIVPRYTYDEDAIDDTEMHKLEKGIMGTYVRRRAGTHNVIEPINQPSFSENAIQTLTLSDKEFKDVGGVGGDARVAQSKTATQAKIAEVKEQVQDGWDRQIFGKFLGEVAEELLMLALDHMTMDFWVEINAAPEGAMLDQESMIIQKQYEQITAEKLQAAASGMGFDVDIDMDSISPVTEEERFQKIMQAISFLGNPAFLQVFAVAPQLLRIVLNYMGIRNGNDLQEIQKALQSLVQIQMAQAQQGAQPPPGVSPQPGGSQPGKPTPQTQNMTPGGPQPGGPAGPGASVPQE